MTRDTSVVDHSALLASRRPSPLGLSWLAIVVTIAGLCLNATARADVGATHTSLVSEFASFNTPNVIDGRVEAIAVDGDTVFVGGNFTQVQDPLGGDIVDQPYLFAYSKSTGNILRDFDPVLNNDVYVLETTGDGTGVFVGGVFNILNGEGNNRGLVKLNQNGDRVPGFNARPDALVRTLVRLEDTLYVGGNFSRISQTPVEHLAAIDTTTGSVDPNLSLDFDGPISTRTITGVQGVFDIDVTSDGELMVVVGNFQTIDGASRPRLALVELDGQARVSTWNTNVFDVQCRANRFPQYIRGIDIAPDDSYFLTGTTGARSGLDPACDTILRFELDDLTDTDAQPTWANFTGGDSVYEVVSTGEAIYVGGHFRWLDNRTSANAQSAGPGSVERRGLAALDPRNGLTLLDWRSDRNPRGLGTFALIAEDEGLYIGDDTDFLNGTEHRRFKFLPITSASIDRPDVASLPTSLLTPDGAALDASLFDGTTIGSELELFNSGWSDARGALFLSDQLFHADSSGNMWVSNFTNDSFDARRPVDLFGLTANEWQLSQLGGMFFDHELGRVYYTLRGQSELYYRGFTPDGPYFGNDQYIAAEQADIPWNDVRGMDVIDGYLYFGRTDGNLYRTELSGYVPVGGTTEIISGPGIDGRDWNNGMIAFVAESAMNKTADGAEFEFQFSGTDTNRSFRQFEFPVRPNEPVNVRLSWLDSSAELDIWIRDSNNALVASNTNPTGSPKWLSVPAGVGGTYVATVQIQQGATSYTLQINPEEQPPAPLADFEFASSGNQTSGRWQVFNFDVQAGDLIEAQVIWDDADASLDLFLRDETGTSVTSDTDDNGSPAMVSTFANSDGQWSVGVLVRSGSAEYDVLIDTTEGIEPPAPLADFEFSSSGDQTSGRWQVFRFDVEAGDFVEAEVVWDDTDANINVYLRDDTGTSVDRDTDGSGSPAMVSAFADSSGQWSIGVLIQNGSAEYDVLVDTTEGIEPPSPLADFEFSSSGDQTSGRWQVFNFDVDAGDLVEAQVLWDNTDANVNVFLRDATGGQVDRDTDGSGSPGMVSATADTSGRWSVGVLVQSGSTSYDVLVDAR